MFGNLVISPYDNEMRLSRPFTLVLVLIAGDLHADSGVPVPELYPAKPGH